MKKYFSLVIILLFSINIHGQTVSNEVPKRIILQIETSHGDFFIRLLTDKAPKTCENFLSYVDDDYYNDTLFHRIIPGFIIQGGGFEKGLIPKAFKEPIENESKNSVKNTKGTMGMALNTNKSSAASQFYINLADNPDLDYSVGSIRGYTVFAEIIDGMNTINKISKIQTRQVTFQSTLYQRNIIFYDYPEEEISIKSIKRLD